MEISDLAIGEVCLVWRDIVFVVRFQGGLGNQMFQASFLWMLELLYPQKEILADLTPYSRELCHHGYELKRIFDIDFPEATRKELIQVTHYEPCVRGFLLSVWRKLFSADIPKDTELCEDYSSPTANAKFYADLFPLKQEKLYLTGFWVWRFNEAYQINDPNIIHAWREKIKQSFIFPDEIHLALRQWIERMQRSASVSVHLRRGDYVGTNFDVCTQSYYEAARSCIEEKIHHPTYYVFSDDLSYAKRVFQDWGAVEFVDGNCGADAWKDMFLMSRCCHHIIANSTFSFWAAYLGEKRSDTMVIAPKEYYRNIKGFCLTQNDWVTL